MSNSSLVDFTLLSPYYTWMSNKKNKKITIHHAAGKVTAEGLGWCFVEPGKNASSNYGIGYDGKIGLYVEEHYAAWTSSNSNNDQQAVTIEVSNDSGAPNWHVSDAALNSLVALCVDICRRNGIERLNYTGDKTGNLTMHKWFANTACPGPYLESKFPWIAEQVNKKLGVSNGGNSSSESTSTSTSTEKALSRGATGKEVTELQKKLIAIGYNCGSAGADGQFGMGTESAVRAFQDNAGIAVTGVVNAKTANQLNDCYTFAKSYTFEKFVRDIQKATGAVVDGIPGAETLSKTVTLSASINPRHPAVLAVQKRMYAMGYAIIGSRDGVAGSKFTKTVINYQRDMNCYADGEITAQNATWKNLLKLG